ncbi:MAG: 2-C-methyl-D-erythritol 4-phosphate cytidylyltransferase [Hydrogenothermaceae bacterium]|nr:2-C-methyl-D-erythritol 4-phosphate cytidylyltransferase [Hydrogenothermaceae bacterium]
MRIDCILLAAGSGRRFGGKKQFLEIKGKRIVDFSLETISKIKEVDRVVLILPPEELDFEVRVEREVIKVVGGKERQDSVYNGLKALGESDVVVIHDSARPFATVEMFKESIENVKRGCDGSITAYRAVDTIKRVIDGVVLETLERNQIYIVQTPQAFLYEKLLKAHYYGRERGILGTDDSYLMEIMGYRICVNEGSFLNFKITKREDMLLAERLIIADL